MKKSLEISLRILIIVLFIGITLLFLLRFLVSIPKGGVGDDPVRLMSVSFLLLINLFLGFAYKSVAKSKLFLTLSLVLIILFVVYFIISGILLLTDFCPSHFNFFPEVVDPTEKQPAMPLEEILQIFFCPFSGRVS